MLFSFSEATAAALAFGLFATGVSASPSACSTTLTPKNGIQPSSASGYTAALVATGLTTPRSIEFDSNGNLLVVQAGVGIVNLAFQDDGGTSLSVKSSKNVIESPGLNHGLALSKDGRTLYASTSEAAYSWPYDPDNVSVGSTNSTIVQNMATSDHTTRTLLMSQQVNGTLIVSRGSTSNVDPEAEVESSGHSQIKAFNLLNISSDGYDFDADGLLLGWGLRNSVGVAEHPLGGLYSVENSVDQLMRQGQDVHEDNPGEEMNFHGYLQNNNYSAQGSNYGYPYCFAAWVPAEIPDNSNLTVGSQFAMGDQNTTVNDTLCAERIAPRLTFQAHMAPLDIVFNNSGTEAWVTFHGSWDATSPRGYKVSVIQFANGEPVAPANSNTSYDDVFANADNSKCPNNCFRPVGIAFDSQNRMFVSSDASGEIYVVMRDSASNGTSPTTTSSAPASSSSKISSAKRLWTPVSIALVAVLLTICVGC